MIEYIEPVIRPPAEADSLILQATIGCSHNKCLFCPTYKTKTFKIVKKEHLFAQIDWASQNIPLVKKVFLADGDALAIPTDQLKEILHRLHLKFPQLKKIGVYASPENFKTKTVQELTQLKQEGISIVYVGFESGDDTVLAQVKKGFTSSQISDYCQKANQAGLKISATVILGLGGPSLSTRHAINTAQLIDKVKPRFASALTLMLPFGEKKYRQLLGDPTWRLLTPLETIKELRVLIENINENKIIFRSNHASNYLSIAGTFSKSKKNMLAQIDSALENPSLFKPEFLRAL